MQFPIGTPFATKTMLYCDTLTMMFREKNHIPERKVSMHYYFSTSISMQHIFNMYKP